MQRPSVYEINETLRAILPFFRSKRLLSLYRLLYLYIREKTNLRREGETKVEVK